MSLSSTTNRVSYAGNGTTTVFAYSNYFLDDSDLVVLLVNDTTGVETVQTITTDYTVSGAGDEAGGSVTMGTAPASGETLVIYRSPALTQGVDLRENDSLPAEVVEEALDRQMMIAQRTRELAERSMRLPDGFTGSFSLELPSDIDTASSVVIVNAAGDAFEMGPTADEISGAQASALAAAASETAAGNSATAAAGSATAASGSSDLAEDWASKVDGVVDATDYSSKAWSIGGTGVTDTATRGAAKEWATKTSATVDGSDYSAKEYAKGTQTRGVSGGGSAKDWANYTAGTVDDTEYSAKKYAADAETAKDAILDADFLEFDEQSVDPAGDPASGRRRLFPKADGWYEETDAGTVNQILDVNGVKVLTDQSSTPATPAAGLTKIYSKNDGKIYKISDDGLEQSIGSGAGGGFSLVTDPYFQAGIGTFAAHADQTTLTGGTTTGVTVTAEANDTSILSGDFKGNLKVEFTAADHSDKGVADLYTIPEGLKGKAVWGQLRFYSDVALDAGDFELAAYDVANSSVINIYGLTDQKLPGIAADGVATVQFKMYMAGKPGDATARTIRFGANRVTADATATVFRMSALQLSDVPLVDVPISGYLGTYTPIFVGFGTPTSVNFDYWRRDDLLYVKFRFTSGTVSGAAATISLPSGLTCKTSGSTVSGSAWAQGATDKDVLITASNGASVVNFINSNSGGASLTGTNLGSTSIVDGWFEIKINEWENQSGVISTRGLMNENPVAIYTGNGGEALTANTTNIAFSTKEKDTHNAWDGDEFTAPSTGYYSFNGAVTLTANVAQDISSYINGAERRVAGTEVTGDNVHMFNGFRYLQKGQKLSIRASANATLSNSAIFHVINIKKDPDLTVLAPYGEPLKTQTKFLSADVTTDTTLSDLTFNNLTIGKWYKVKIQGVFQRLSAGIDNAQIKISHDSTELGRVGVAIDNSSFSYDHDTVEFQATATTLTFESVSISSGTSVEGNGTKTNTYATLSETQQMQETTEYS